MMCHATFRGHRCIRAKAEHVMPHITDWIVSEDGRHYRYEWRDV